MRYRTLSIWAGLAVGVLQAACGSGTPGSGGSGGSGSGGSGSGGAAPPAQTPACAMLLTCLSTLGPGAYAAALGTYGPDGTCWKSTSTVAAECDAACKAGFGDCGTGVVNIIDTGATFSVEPAQGVAVVIEVAQGGAWHVVTSCDTDFSGKSCNFDIVASPAAGVTLSAPQGEGLDASATLEQQPTGAIALSTKTDTKLEGMKFAGTPGGAVSFDVRLGGQPAPGIVRWMSGGEIAPSALDTPVVLKPSSP